MIGSTQDIKKVYTTQSTISIPDSSSNLAICASAYSDCILIIVNETGSVGSILRGEMVALAQQQLDDDYNYEQPNNQDGKEFIYDQKVLFGSTQIQFYELVMRKLLELVFEQNKVPMEKEGAKMRVILNIALKVNKQGFDETKYFKTIMDQMKKMLKQIV